MCGFYVSGRRRSLALAYALLLGRGYVSELAYVGSTIVRLIESSCRWAVLIRSPRTNGDNKVLRIPVLIDRIVWRTRTSCDFVARRASSLILVPVGVMEYSYRSVRIVSGSYCSNSGKLLPAVMGDVYIQR